VHRIRAKQWIRSESIKLKSNFRRKIRTRRLDEWYTVHTDTVSIEQSQLYGGISLQVAWTFDIENYAYASIYDSAAITTVSPSIISTSRSTSSAGSHCLIYYFLLYVEVGGIQKDVLLGFKHFAAASLLSLILSNSKPPAATSNMIKSSVCNTSINSNYN